MKINIDKQIDKEITIKAGDIIRVKLNNKEFNYLICQDDERLYLLDLSDFYILGVYEESNVEEFLENNEMTLLEIIPSDQIELRRTNENNSDNSEKSNDLILDIVKAYERLAISVDSEIAYDLNREEMDLNVVYSDDGKYHCHLDVLWDEVYNFNVFDNMIEIDEKDKDKDVIKLFIRLYVFRDGTIIDVKEIELSELITMDDRELDKYMVDFLNEYIKKN